MINKITTELTFRCNSQCTGCARKKIIENKILDLNNPKYTQTTESFKQMFPETFLKEVNIFFLSGIFGDSIMCPDFLEIVAYIKSCGCTFNMSTNGSAHNKDYWTKLGDLLTKNDEVEFCLDGLSDTHSIYRVGTSFEKIIENAQAIILTGRTNVTWKFIVFSHNEHQIEEARTMAKKLGFTKFAIKYNNRGRLIPKQKKYRHKKYKTNIFLNFITKLFGIKINHPVTCKGSGDFFVSPEGLIFKCCYAESNYYNKRFEYTYPENIEERFNAFKRPIDEIINDQYWKELSEKVADKNKAEQLCQQFCKKNSLNSGYIAINKIDNK